MASRTAYSRTQIAALAKAYRRGASLSVLSKKMGRVVSCIRNVLVKAGVKMRPRGRAKGAKVARKPAKGTRRNRSRR